MSRPRLSPDKWISAGFEALAVSGPMALAAEPLARALGTTKGSFYWHFKDVPAYQEALVTKWQAQALEQVLDQLQQSDDADKRLRDFGRVVLADPVEPQLRIWGQNDGRVHDALIEVDAQRLAYLTRLLGQLGLRNAEFARALQAALTGLSLNRDTDIAPFDTLVDTVLALR
ncbi:MAG: TetR/AcrR family transcriptional regulator [Sulfitobacter sp.]|nr:TetR/AcrR family transcriptional regulator [Sulfitobacter sp.]